MMENTVAEYRKEDEGLILRIYQDNNPDDPRGWDNLGTMVCWHRHHKLGDKHNYREPEDFWFAMAEEIVGDKDKVEAMSEEQRRKVAMDSIIMLPLFLLDHSGLWMSTSHFGIDPQGWDTSCVGLIYVTKEQVKREMRYAASKKKNPDLKPIKRISKKQFEHVRAILQSEVEEYNQFLCGDVYGYVIQKKVECENCHCIDHKTLDSCWGFYGTDWHANGLLDSVGQEWSDIAS